MKRENSADEKIFQEYLNHPLKLNKEDIYILKKLVRNYGTMQLRLMKMGLKDASERVQILHRKLNYFGRKLT